MSQHLLYRVSLFPPEYSVGILIIDDVTRIDLFRALGVRNAVQ